MRTLITFMLLTLSGQTAIGSELIELQLINKLDEPRSYCIDIKGHKERAKVHRGLQAHTCYSYQGQLAVDQAFDKRLVHLGRFYLPAFKVCMEAQKHIEGASLILNECNNTTFQKFNFNLNNQIKVIGESNLCVAVEANKSRQGGGGTPPHRIRGLILTECSQTVSKYTAWKTK